MLFFTSPNIFSGTATKSSPTITIDPTTVYQTMAGAGAALTDATVGLLAAGKAGDPNGYSAFLADMFNRYTGLSIVRVPIGATDFSTDLYTLADAVPTANATSDPVTAIAQSFSSARLLSGPVPLLQDILAVRSDLKVMLSPWSAPPWSKQNQAFSGGWLLTGFENAYGEYLAQTVSAYQSAGINIYGLTVQNEPSFAASYPSTRLTSTQQNMVAGYLKNRLQALGYGSIQVRTSPFPPLQVHAPDCVLLSHLRCSLTMTTLINGLLLATQSSPTRPT
jgi:O-glycosyl hydrolase